jgi:molybdopterin-guanine dinucleotide biosynthesis protein B
MKTVSFVAATSNSGKTTLIEKLVQILKERGLRVAVVKHAPKGFDIDRPSKDSWRFRDAGADAVLLVGPGGLALQRQSAGIADQRCIEKLVGPVDIVLREGFKDDGGDRIEVFRFGISGDRPLCYNEKAFRALVSDVRIDCGIPWFHIDDAQGVADLIAKL